MQNALEHSLLVNGAFHTLDILDVKGRIIGNTQALEDDNGNIHLLKDSIEKKIGRDYSSDPLFKEVQKTGKYLAREEIRANDQEMDVIFSLPIFTRNDQDEKQFIGVIIAKMDMLHIWKIVNAVPLDTGEQILLYNHSGAIISGPDRATLFLKEQNPTRSLELLGLGKTGIEVGKDIDGIEKIFSFAPLQGFKTYKGLGWGIEVSQPTDKAFQKIALLRLSIIGSILFVILSVFFLIAVIWKQFTIPLSHLLKNVRKMSEGDYNIETDIKTHDEIGVLARAFSHMGVKIRENIKILNEYKNLIDTSSLVSKMDIDGNFITVNDIFCTVSGYTLEELQGKWYKTIRHPDTTPEVFKDLWHTMKAKEIWSGVLKNIRKDGSVYWVSTIAAPIVDINNKITEYIFIETDITELEQTKEELMESYSKLQQSTEELVAKERISKEFELAEKIQEDFLPNPEMIQLDGLDVYCGISSASEIGGDLYDIVPCHADEKKTIFYIGDVTGHGLISGIMMAICNSLIFQLSNYSSDIRNILIRLNTTLFYKLPKKVFITMLMVEYDTETKKFVFAGAGHEQLVIYRKKTDSIEEIQTGGSALGMFKKIDHDVVTRDLPMESGDIILMFTDGIPEARNKKGEFYGMDRFKESFKNNAHRTMSGIYEGLRKDLYGFIGEAEILDDITLMVIRKD